MPRVSTPSASKLSRRALCAAITVAGLATLGAAAPAMAQGKYPNKAITLTLPFPPGSATDSMMRAMQPVLSKTLGQTIVIENRPGAAGTMAAAVLAQSKQADGYHLAVAPATLFKVPHMQKVPYDPLKDLTYVVGFSAYTFGLVVPGNSPWKTLDDFVAAAKAAPQPLSVATTGTGSSGHAATVLLAQEKGIKLQSVPFKGGSEVLQAFMGGHVQAMLDGGWAQGVRQGGGRALVTFTDKRQSVEGVPTARELGINLVSRSPIGIVAPKGLDPQIAHTIQEAVKLAMRDPAVQKALETYDLADAFLTGEEYRKVGEQLWVEEKKNLEMLGIIESK